MIVKYNQQTLKKASSDNIQPDGVYQGLLNGIPDREVILAKRSINGENYQWKVPNSAGERWQKLGDATPMEVDAVRAYISEYKRRAADVLRLNQADINDIFTTPDDQECILFTMADSRLRVIITGWDFVKINEVKQGQVIISTNEHLTQEVVIRFVKAGEAVSGVPFVLTLDSGFVGTYTMPANGMFRLGSINVGLNIGININDGQLREIFTVQQGKSVYDFNLPEPEVQPEPEPTIGPEPIIEPEPTIEPEPKPEIEPVPDPEPEPEIKPMPEPVTKQKVKPTILVVDAEGTPIETYPIDISFPDNHSEHVITDESGQYELPEMEEDESFSVADHFSGSTTTFTICRDRQIYEVTLNYSSVVQSPDISVKVIDEKGKPVFPGRIALRQDEHTLLISQKEDGVFYLSDGYFKSGDPIEVKLQRGAKDEYTASDFVLSESEKEYVIQLDTKDCPLWLKILEGVIGAVAMAAAVWLFIPAYVNLWELISKTY